MAVGGFNHMIALSKGFAYLGAVGRILVRHQQDLGAAFRRSGACSRGGRGLLLVAQQRLKRGAGHGLCKIVALYVVAADLLQTLQLRPGLHALGHYAQIHPAGQIHDKAQDPLIHGLGRLALDEFHIQLQNVQRHLIEHIQGGVAASKVVHFNDKAQLPQPAYRGRQLVRMLRVGALRDLQMQAGGGKAVCFKGGCQKLDQIRLIHIGP